VEESFGLAIREHLDLQRRNRELETDMPLAHYLEGGVASVNGGEHALEDTQEWVLPEAGTVIDHGRLFPSAEELWSGTPAFDWGD
jgi:hypothetical protein